MLIDCSTHLIEDTQEANCRYNPAMLIESFTVRS